MECLPDVVFCFNPNHTEHVGPVETTRIVDRPISVLYRYGWLPHLRNFDHPCRQVHCTYRAVFVPLGVGVTGVGLDLAKDCDTKQVDGENQHRDLVSEDSPESDHQAIMRLFAAVGEAHFRADVGTEPFAWVAEYFSSADPHVASSTRGLVVEPAAFDDALGLSETGGWFYAVIGAVSAITRMISPTIVSRR